MIISLTPSLRISLEKDKILTISICVIWGSMLFFYLKGIINRLPILQDYSDETLFVAYLLPVLAALPALINKFSIADYLFFAVNVLYYLSCYIFLPENATYLTEHAFKCICCVFPFYFLGRLIDIDKFFDAFVYLSAVCIFMDLFYYLFYAPSNKVMEEVAGEDNMFTAYQV